MCASESCEGREPCTITSGASERREGNFGKQHHPHRAPGKLSHHQASTNGPKAHWEAAVGTG